MVVDNHVHGAAVLREHHHQVTERDVIVTSVPERTRMRWRRLLKLVGDADVNVEYATAAAPKVRMPP